jgi:hypothetical protein
VIDVRRPPDGTGGGYLFLAPTSGPGLRGALILDDAGEVVWFHKTYPRSTMDFKPGHYRGRPVLTWWEGRFEEGIGRVGQYVIMDSSYREIARFRAARGRLPDFHEFLITERNTALVTAHHAVSADLTSVGGRRDGRVLVGIIQELALPSGRLLWEWRSTDHVAVDESYSEEIGTPHDYFHINSVAVDDDDNLIVSARNTWAVYKLHRRTGEVIWRLGGKRSDFEMGRGTQFAYQHDARPRDGGGRISLFDNGPVPGTRPESRAITIKLELARKRATLVREHRHLPPVQARVTGSAQVLPNSGDMLVTWGSTGWFSQYGREGEVRFDAKLPPGGQNYRVFRSPWVGRPTHPPVAVARDRMLYASWNGATEVASWQLRAGPRASALAPGERTPRDGFETALRVPAAARFAAAFALDGAGRVLGRTRTLRV